MALWMWMRSVFSLPNNRSRLVAKSVPSMIAASIIMASWSKARTDSWRSGQLARKRSAWGRCFARMKVEKDRAGPAVRPSGSSGKPLLLTKRILRTSKSRITVVRMSAEFSDGGVAGSEDLPVYAVKTGSAQRGYGGPAARPLLQRLSARTAHYALTALLIFAVSHGRREPYLRTVISRPAPFELPVAIVAMFVYLTPLAFAYSSMAALLRLLRKVRAPVAG